MLLQSKDINHKSGFFNDADRIQVIVKLANIHLTPEKPTYGGGPWHIEGQLNEHICATALYYYDNDNITESRLNFRTTADREQLRRTLRYEQNDYYSIERTFRIDAQGLVDKTKPGHRKILALFLVDPAIPVISTANVPPQQRDWWKEGVAPDDRIGPLPVEVTDMVFDNLDFPIGLEQAKKIREELMAERTAIAGDCRFYISQREYMFCEH
ncbi:hypothetical protein Ct61P_13479 [Colletotrichum tofieldiae]|nr:hypothetical protein Ct61P_13479 [Colletotrichum tofieldiae]